MVTIKQNRPSLGGPACVLWTPLNDLAGFSDEAWDVGGSPTMVINNEVISVSRSPEAYKQAICDAFINPPIECDTVLSTAATSPGIGGGTGTTSSGGCASQVLINF